jgi:tRNA threonylcarbamoyl adenosine modification protein YeaZ
VLILAVDTSTDYATMAVGDEAGTLLGSKVFAHHRSLSQHFYSALDKALATAGVSFDDIDILAVGVGPGSFTGVRVAVTTMRTLAQVTQKRLVGVGTLEAYAREAYQEYSGRAICVLPSRKSEVYLQEFLDGNPVSLPSVASYLALESTLDSDHNILLAGQCEVLPQHFSRFAQFPQLAPSPLSLIELAAINVLANAFADPLSLAPTYAALPAISQHKSR